MSENEKRGEYKYSIAFTEHSVSRARERTGSISQAKKEIEKAAIDIGSFFKEPILYPKAIKIKNGLFFVVIKDEILPKKGKRRERNDIMNVKRVIITVKKVTPESVRQANAELLSLLNKRKTRRERKQELRKRVITFNSMARI